MKTIFLTITMLFVSNNTNANMLVFHDLYGNILLQPKVVEREIDDTIPDLIFDISKLSKPETDIDDIPEEFKITI